MSFVSGLAIYFIIWWLTLFAVLPYGVRSQAEENDIVPGSEPGAPHKSNLAKKLLINCIVAGVVFGLYWLITGPLGYSLEDVPSVFPDHLGS